MHAQLLQPVAATEPHPAVLQFHGYSGSSGDWVTKLPFAALGHSVAALDMRGQGGLSVDEVPVAGWAVATYLLRGIDDDIYQLMSRL